MAAREDRLREWADKRQGGFELGSWEFGGGVFVGFGFGVVWQPGEFQITLGCLCFGGNRV